MRQDAAVTMGKIYTIVPVVKRTTRVKMDDDARLLHRLYDYDPLTGEWLLREHAEGGRGRKRKVGERVGTIDKRDGSRIIRFKGRGWRASQLAWLYVHGEWPPGQVLYRDPDLPVPIRDAIDNLRLAGKNEDISQAELHRLFSLDTEIGRFKWIVSRKGVKAGTLAGSTRLIEGKKYWYVRIDGTDYMVHRLMWRYLYGRWPSARMVFKDGNTENVSIHNLMEGEFEHGTRQSPEFTEEDRRRQLSKTWRKHDLKRHFDITPTEWDIKFAAQNGVCGICGKQETAKANDGITVRRLSLDHDHGTGVNRDLLCDACNKVMHEGRSSEYYRKIADYIDRHAISSDENAA